MTMLFFFSATGNSQYAAEKIAAATGDRLISIGPALRDEHFTFDVSGDERIGFIIPTFAWTLPGAVAHFINHMKLRGYTDQYVFGVFTCGESTGHESAALQALLKEKSMAFHGSFELVMPDNFIIWSDVPAPKRLDALLKSADNTLETIIGAVKAKRPGKIDTGKPKELYMPMNLISSKDGTSQFYATSDCIGCGLCRSLCPMRCIKEDDDRRPVWDGTCTMCLACLHRCPAKAIQHGKDTLNKGRYVNPNVEFRFDNQY
jgi:ferredoxin/flavodoxin